MAAPSRALASPCAYFWITPDGPTAPDIRYTDATGSLSVDIPRDANGAYEFLSFRAEHGAYRVYGDHLAMCIRAGAIVVPALPLLEIQARVWLCGKAEESFGWQNLVKEQVDSTNRCLAQGAAPADSGIRLRILEVTPTEQILFSQPQDITCIRPLEPFSRERGIVDIYLHNHRWAARACPHTRRIFLGAPALSEFTLAHEFAHLLGLPNCAHVDNNRYLDAGNVMDLSPTGGRGELTLGQLYIFHASADSLAAQDRHAADAEFPLCRCLDHDGNPLDAPPLGYHFSD